MNTENIQIFIYGREVDLDALVKKYGPDWRAIFADPSLAHALDFAFDLIAGDLWFDRHHVVFKEGRPEFVEHIAEIVPIKQDTSERAN